MNLKNFSLYDAGHGHTLTPSYDLVSTALVIPDDPEELALTLNGKKRKLRRSDFMSAMSQSELSEKVIDNMAKKFRRAFPKWLDLINISFLPEDMKRNFKRMILQRMLLLR